MSGLARLLLVRHGDTVGESRIRFHGSNDVALSETGRAEARRARAQVPLAGIDRMISSTQSRAWETALIIARGRPVLLESDFREIDFGRWEGLTRQEIAAQDPVLHADWEQQGAAFDFPGGEPRAAFRARVDRGLQRLMARQAEESVVVVAHKGVVRRLAETLTGEKLEAEQPLLGGVLQVTRRADGAFALRTLLG
ncbi:MAG: histidine phosphatase family protein [Myxococcota bacterium]|nr:histidine phosphatase family protein [Myxococcota bacterium]